MLTAWALRVRQVSLAHWRFCATMSNAPCAYSAALPLKRWIPPMWMSRVIGRFRRWVRIPDRPNLWQCNFELVTAGRKLVFESIAVLCQGPNPAALGQDLPVKFVRRCLFLP